MINDPHSSIQPRERLRDGYFIGEVPRSEPDGHCLRDSG
jgi:hypothetical protein